MVEQAGARVGALFCIVAFVGVLVSGCTPSDPPLFKDHYKFHHGSVFLEPDVAPEKLYHEFSVPLEAFPDGLSLDRLSCGCATCQIAKNGKSWIIKVGFDPRRAREHRTESAYLLSGERKVTFSVAANIYPRLLIAPHSFGNIILKGDEPVERNVAVVSYQPDTEQVSALKISEVCRGARILSTGSPVVIESGGIRETSMTCELEFVSELPEGYATSSKRKGQALSRIHTLKKNL